MLVLELIQRQAEKFGQSVAIEAPGRNPLNYQGLYQQVQRTTQQLRSIGVAASDRVAIVLPNGPEMAVVFLAVTSLAVSAPLNPQYLQPEYEFYLTDLRPKALIVMHDDESAVIEVARELGIMIIRLITSASDGSFILAAETDCSPNPHVAAVSKTNADVALVLHTSGTTSRPKIVQLTQANLLASAENIAKTLALTPSDRCLNIMPLFHIHGLMAAVMASVWAGASIICCPGFLQTKFFSWMEKFRPTWYTAVPTMHQAILARAQEHKHVLETVQLRFLRSSSASLPPSVLHELESTFCAPVIEAYGMTEAAHQMSSNPLPPGTRIAGTVGLAAGPEMAIMDETGNMQAAGITGEVVIRGDNVTPGYCDNPIANAAAFTQGWFRTGDQGIIDHQGYLTITGRLKEIINRGGEKISPREIDEVLLGHPAVQQVVTFAVPDRNLGEDVAAAVVLRRTNSTSEAELRQYAAQQLAFFKIPKKIVFLEKIPMGPTGKLLRIGLAEKLGITEVTVAPVADQTPPSSETEHILCEIWLNVLGLHQNDKQATIGIHSRFIDVGGDSVLAAQISLQVNKTFTINFPISNLFELPTISKQAEAIDVLRWMHKNSGDSNNVQGEEILI